MPTLPSSYIREQSSIIHSASRPTSPLDHPEQLSSGHNYSAIAIAFQPGSILLASAAEDGRVCLWKQAQQAAQILEGAPQGFSTLTWSPDGQWLAAGGKQGEWLVWKQSKRGKGFG